VLSGDPSLPEALLPYLSASGITDAGCLREMVRQWQEAIRQQMQRKQDGTCLFIIASCLCRDAWQCSSRHSASSDVLEQVWHTAVSAALSIQEMDWQASTATAQVMDHQCRDDSNMALVHELSVGTLYLVYVHLSVVGVFPSPIHWLRSVTAARTLGFRRVSLHNVSKHGR
jgi:hypothetical protein